MFLGENNFQRIPKVTLAYDNMCNLDRMKVAQQPLPFPSPFDKLWLNVVKIIDVFHFRNHTSKKCHSKYNPAKTKADNPHFNTQAGEQTFVWVARFKHILCSMNKTHHLFYLHRMVVRRNWYTSKCYKNGKKTNPPEENFIDNFLITFTTLLATTSVSVCLASCCNIIPCVCLF